jgi:hypothetical protein
MSDDLIEGVARAVKGAPSSSDLGLNAEFGTFEVDMNGDRRFLSRAAARAVLSYVRDASSDLDLREFLDGMIRRLAGG